MPAKHVPNMLSFNPLRLMPDYREYFGDQHALFVRATDRIERAGCYVPRIYHAPDSTLERLGLGPRENLDYTLAVPAGSFLLGFLHNTTGSPNAGAPPAVSSYAVQITDAGADYKLFSRPVPETFFLNDSADPFTFGGSPFDLVKRPATPRLLPVPYPMVPPAQLRFEFWNQLATLNTLIQLSLLVAVPDPDQ